MNRGRDYSSDPGHQGPGDHQQEEDDEPPDEDDIGGGQGSLEDPLATADLVDQQIPPGLVLMVRQGVERVGLRP